MGDGLLQAADLVHQTQLQGVLATPDPALGQRFDFADRHRPALGDAVDELAVTELDLALDDAARCVAEPTVGAETAGQLGGAQAVGVDAQLVQTALEGGDQTEYADGTGNRAGVREDAVGVHGHPVAAGSRHVAHRHHHRLALFAYLQHRPTNTLRTGDAATGRVDPQHHRLHRILGRGLAQQVSYQEGIGNAFVAIAVDDFALHHHQADLLLLALGGKLAFAADGAEIIVMVYLAEAAMAVLVHADDLARALAESLQRLDLGNQIVLLRVTGGVAHASVHALGQPGHVSVDGAGIQPPRLLDPGTVLFPQIAQPVGVGQARGIRHVLALERLDRALEFAHPENFHGDAQLLQALGEIIVVDRITLDPDTTHRVHRQFVTVRGHLVVGLR